LLKNQKVDSKIVESSEQKNYVAPGKTDDQTKLPAIEKGGSGESMSPNDMWFR